MGKNKGVDSMTEHFPNYELECNCSCGLMNMKQETMDKLERARIIAGIPFGINSASRCQAHNIIEGGSMQSSHLTGYAVDIAITSSRARFKILTALMTVGFTRIGIAKTFVHADDDPIKPTNVSWVY